MDRKIRRLIHGIPREQTSIGNQVFDPVTSVAVGHVIEIRAANSSELLSWGKFEVWVQPIDTTADPYIFSEILTHEYVALFEYAEQESK